MDDKHASPIEQISGPASETPSSGVSPDVPRSSPVTIANTKRLFLANSFDELRHSRSNRLDADTGSASIDDEDIKVGVRWVKDNGEIEQTVTEFAVPSLEINCNEFVERLANSVNILSTKLRVYIHVDDDSLTSFARTYLGYGLISDKFVSLKSAGASPGSLFLVERLVEGGTWPLDTVISFNPNFYFDCENHRGTGPVAEGGVGELNGTGGSDGSAGLGVSGGSGGFSGFGGSGGFGAFGGSGGLGSGGSGGFGAFGGSGGLGGSGGSSGFRGDELELVDNEDIERQIVESVLRVSLKEKQATDTMKELQDWRDKEEKEKKKKRRRSKKCARPIIC